MCVQQIFYVLLGSILFSDLLPLTKYVQLNRKYSLCIYTLYNEFILTSRYQKSLSIGADLNKHTCTFKIQSKCHEYRSAAYIVSEFCEFGVQCLLLLWEKIELFVKPSHTRNTLIDKFPAILTVLYFLSYNASDRHTFIFIYR